MAAMWVTTGWTVARDPELSGLWMVPAVVASALWALHEVAWHGRSAHPTIKVFLRYFLGWIAMAIASLALVQAMTAFEGAASAWATYGQRASGLIVAFGLVLFGNALPTLPSRYQTVRSAATRQRVRRFLGWVFVVTGLGVGASWIALDPEAASRVMNRLLALCFLLVCGQQIASLMDRSAVSPTHVDSL